MKQPNNTTESHIVDVIENRSPAGRNDSVQGWHNLLKEVLQIHLQAGPDQG